MARIVMQLPRLVLKFNNSVTKEIEITQPVVTIGRKPDNDLVIDNPAVSGHHARVSVKDDAHYIEDLASTNGTFVNEKRVVRHQLKDKDRVTIGKHLVVFQEGVKGGEPDPAPEAFDPEKTSTLDTQKQRELLSREKQIGVLQVISGQTDRKEYRLANPLTVIGSKNNAAVKLTGWFAPKTAALISRGTDGYSITTSEEPKPILLNGKAFKGRAALKEGDIINVAGVEMHFYLKDSR